MALKVIDADILQRQQLARQQGMSEDDVQRATAIEMERRKRERAAKEASDAESKKGNLFTNKRSLLNTTVIGGTGGALAGAAGGAALGSVVPVLGTAAGAIVGGILGAAGGSGVGEYTRQKLNDEGSQTPKRSEKRLLLVVLLI